jgi:hypothetical protein
MDIKCSCAFNDSAIEKLNKKAQDIDGRLFLFAYYRPKAFPETESTLVQFYTAVFNLYGLFWDCGSFVKSNLLYIWNKNSLLEHDKYGKPTIKGKKIYNSLNDLIDSLSGLRNTACHNNAPEFYNNQVNMKKTDGFFQKMKLDPAILPLDDWEKCLNELCIQAEEVINGIKYCLNCLPTLPEMQKNKIINYWLENCICKWYLTRKNDFNGYLEELKQLHTAKFHKGDRKLSDWLLANFGVSDNSPWLEKIRLLNLLKDTNQCPTPALPISIFKKLAEDVYNLAMTNKQR